MNFPCLSLTLFALWMIAAKSLSPGLFARRDHDGCQSMARRDCVHSLNSGVNILVGTGLCPTAGASYIPPECQNGALVAESVVPGAYDHVCMNLPLRIIPTKLLGANASVTLVDLVIQQDGVGAGRTGLAVWNAGILLGRLLERLVLGNPAWFQGLRVAELGCGAGLVSLLCAQWGARSVWATDGNPTAVALTRANFDRNRVPYSTAIGNVDDTTNAVIAQMKWGDLQVPLEWMGRVDLIVGSDLTYNSGSWRVLAETMDALLSPKGAVLYLSSGHFGFNVGGELEGFVNVAKHMGLHPVTNNLPLDLPRGVTSLDSLLQSVVLPPERSLLAATGGAQAILLSRRRT